SVPAPSESAFARSCWRSRACAGSAACPVSWLCSCDCSLVGLLAQEYRDVVLVDPAVLQPFYRRGAVLADYRGHLVEHAVVHTRNRPVVGTGLLHQLQPGLTRDLRLA